MEFTVTSVIAAPPAAVMRAAHSEQAATARMDTVKIDPSHVTRTVHMPDGAAASGGSSQGAPTGSITTEIALPPEMIPDKVRRFASSGAQVTITEHFATDHIQTQVEVARIPVSASWRTTLVPLEDGQRTELTYRGEVSARIPFIGGQIERKALAHVEQVVRRDAAILEQLAAGSA